MNQWTSESTNHRIKKTKNEWISGSTTQWINEINESVDQWLNQWTNESSESMNKSTNSSMNEWINEALNQWANESVDQWLNQWTNESSESMNQSTNESKNEWINEALNQWTNESVNQWISEWTNEWRNEWIEGWVDGWMDGRMDGWMDGWMAEWATFLCELLLHWATSSLRQLFSQLLLLSTSALTCLAASSSAAPATQLFSSRSCYSAIPHSTRVALWSRTTSQYNAFSNLQLQSRLLGVSHHHWCFPARSRANASSQPGANPHSRSVGPNRPPSTV